MNKVGIITVSNCRECPLVYRGLSRIVNKGQGYFCADLKKKYHHPPVNVTQFADKEKRHPDCRLFEIDRTEVIEMGRIQERYLMYQLTGKPLYNDDRLELFRPWNPKKVYSLKGKGGGYC